MLGFDDKQPAYYPKNEFTLKCYCELVYNL